MISQCRLSVPVLIWCCPRCLRMNRVQLKDLVLQQACEQSTVRYEDLGLPQELTVWVDPGEVSCRSGRVLAQGTDLGGCS